MSDVEKEHLMRPVPISLIQDDPPLAMLCVEWYRVSDTMLALDGDQREDISLSRLARSRQKQGSAYHFTRTTPV